MNTRRLASTVLCCVVLTTALVADAADLVLRDIYEWSEEHEAFGGFSGLSVTSGGGSLMAVSDRGWLIQAVIRRGADGRLAGIETVWRGRFLDNQGKEVTGFKADAETLTIGAEGRVIVGFESYARIAAFRPPDMTPDPQHRWDRFREFWGNEGFEALALAPDGDLIVILEEPEEGGRNFRTIVGKEREWRDGPDLAASDGFAVSDATFGPDGMLYILERRFGYVAGFTSRIRRFPYSNSGFGLPETLLQTEPGDIDNMEGISLWRDHDGRIVVTLISDDNFLPVQNTIVVEYDLVE